MDKFFMGLWETLVGEEEASKPTRAHKTAVSSRRTIKHPYSRSMLKEANLHSNNRKNLTAFALLEKERKHRYTLKQGHKAKGAISK